jgi:hypothetical protein
VAKTAGNSLGIPADFFLQENPQVKSRFLVVLVKLFLNPMWISVWLPPHGDPTKFGPLNLKNFMLIGSFSQISV